jgi:hypothetical protein
MHASYHITYTENSSASTTCLAVSLLLLLRYCYHCQFYYHCYHTLSYRSYCSYWYCYIHCYSNNITTTTTTAGYEAYTLFNFLYYLIALLGDEQTLTSALKNKPPTLGQHPFPLSLCLNRWPMGRSFLTQCKLGVLQYVVLKNAAVLAMFALEKAGCYRGKRCWCSLNYSYVLQVYVYVCTHSVHAGTWCSVRLQPFVHCTLCWC